MANPADKLADSAPELHNAEQDDEDTQAQQIAADAQDAATSNFDGDSEHGGKTNPAQLEADDAQDVVDHMNQMNRSGRIDMGAYRGERSDDDESGMLGDGGLEPGELDENGNPVGEL